MTSVVKSSIGSVLQILQIEKPVSTLWNNKPVFFLLIIQSFLNFPPIPLFRRAERIRGISGNFQTLKIFFFLSWNLKATLKYVKWLVLNVSGARDHTFMMSTWKWNRGVSTFATCLRILSFLNNRSIIYFWGWGGNTKLIIVLWTS